MNTLSTIGYAQLRSVTQLIELAHPRSAMIADIRFTPWSKDEQWQQPSLLKRMCELDFGNFNCSYIHIRELGNVNYKNGGPIQIFQPEPGLAKLKEHLADRPVILLCGCRNVENCHRKVVADLAAQQFGCEIEHLNPAALWAQPVQSQTSMF